MPARPMDTEPATRANKKLPVAVNVVIMDAEAVVGRTPDPDVAPKDATSTASVTITGGHDVTLGAATNMSNQARALPSDGGGKGSNVGVGASVAVTFKGYAPLVKARSSPGGEALPL